MAFKMKNTPYPLSAAQSEHFDTNKDGKITGSDFPLKKKKKGRDGKACWKGYRLAGTKKKGGKTVDNCVPVKGRKKKRK